MTEAQGRVRLVKMNIDDHPSIAGQLGIQSIPAVIAFVGGRPVDGFMGAVPESQIREFIDKVAGPMVDDQPAEIDAALCRGAKACSSRATSRTRPASSAPCCRPIRRMPSRWPALPIA